MMDAAEKESAQLQDVGSDSRGVRQMWSQQCPQLAAVVTKTFAACLQLRHKIYVTEKK